MRAEYLECGKIINTHGIEGMLKLESWCDTPELLAGLEMIYFREGEEYVAVSIKRASVFKKFVLARIEGIEDIDAAEAMRGRVIYARREDIRAAIGEGGHFIADLIGLPVIDARDGRLYGNLLDVIKGGAADIYLVKTPKGEKMMPAVSEFVEKIDLDNGIYVKPIQGMFD